MNLFVPIAVLTFVNILFLIYWSFIWFRSYQNHRDTVSLVVLLFVIQGFLKEIWSVFFLVSVFTGFAATDTSLSTRLATRIVVTVILVSIQVMAGRLDVESKDADNDR